MPRLFPPHLMVPIALLIVVLWVMLVHHFRHSTSMQKFISETIGEDTPENALSAFESARTRLARHLGDANLDGRTRCRIERALGVPQDETAANPVDNCLT